MRPYYTLYLYRDIVQSDAHRPVLIRIMLFLSILFTSIGFGLQVLFKHLQEKLIITEVGYVNNVMCVIIIIIIISIISKGCKGPLIEVLNTFRKFSFQYL